jgi:hypothetical protein
MLMGAKVFTATKAKDREELGENVTRWIRDNPRARILDKIVTPTLVNQFQMLFGHEREPTTSSPAGGPPVSFRLLASLRWGTRWLFLLKVDEPAPSGDRRALIGSIPAQASKLEARETGRQHRAPAVEQRLDGDRAVRGRDRDSGRGGRRPRRAG